MDSLRVIILAIFVNAAIICGAVDDDKVKKNPNLFLAWGTNDTTIRNNQTVAIWIKARNNNDSGVILLPYPQETYELWIKTADTIFKAGIWMDGNNSFPSKSALFSILKFDLFGALETIKVRTNAKLVLRTWSPFTVPDSEINVHLLPPDNHHLDEWFHYSDSLLKCSASFGRMIRPKSGISNSGSVINEYRFSHCKKLSHWLDSLESNYLAMGTAHANARRFLEINFCQEKSLFEDISLPNWPWIRDAYKCGYLEKSKSPFADKICSESKRRFNHEIVRLANLSSRLPKDKYHSFKFLSGSEIIYLDLTSWFGKIPGELNQ